MFQIANLQKSVKTLLWNYMYYSKELNMINTGHISHYDDIKIKINEVGEYCKMKSRHLAGLIMIIWLKFWLMKFIAKEQFLLMILKDPWFEEKCLKYYLSKFYKPLKNY